MVYALTTRRCHMRSLGSKSVRSKDVKNTLSLQQGINQHIGGFSYLEARSLPPCRGCGKLSLWQNTAVRNQYSCREAVQVGDRSHAQDNYVAEWGIFVLQAKGIFPKQGIPSNRSESGGCLCRVLV